MATDDGSAMPGDDDSNLPFIDGWGAPSGGDIIKNITNITRVTASWGSLDVPGSLQELSKLSTQSAKNLVDFARGPRTFIISTILLWALNGVFNFVEQLMAVILAATTQVAGIPAIVLAPLTDIGLSLSGNAFALFDGLTAPFFGMVNSLGWTAPLVFGLLLLAILEYGGEILPPLLSATASSLSDLLGAIPVVGSVLDALFTFLIQLIEGLLGGN